MRAENRYPLVWWHKYEQWPVEVLRIEMSPRGERLWWVTVMDAQGVERHDYLPGDLLVDELAVWRVFEAQNKKVRQAKERRGARRKV